MNYTDSKIDTISLDKMAWIRYTNLFYYRALLSYKFIE
jgi:hypothetical protein